MLKKILLIAVCLAVGSLAAACGSAEDTNVNSANLPPGFSNQPITPDGNSTPGIPDTNTVNPTNLPAGGTPTPGIPHPANIGKPVKGTTPTPGIPDEETLKRQANTVITDMNRVNNPQNGGQKPPDRKRPQPPGNSQ